MDSDPPKRCTGQVPPKGAPVPYPVWDPIALNLMDPDSTKRCTGQVPPKRGACPIPWFGTLLLGALWIRMPPSGARDRCPQKGHLSHTLVWDPIAWNPMEADSTKRCTGQVPPKGAPVPGHGLEHLTNQSESERIGSNRIEANRVESVRSHGSGQVPPKGPPVPGHGLGHLTNRSESERIR